MPRKFPSALQGRQGNTVSLWSATANYLRVSRQSKGHQVGSRSIFQHEHLRQHNLYRLVSHDIRLLLLNPEYFNSQYNKPSLHADEASGGNGVWQTSATPAFPTQVYLAGNFWVDVVFGGVVAPQ